MVPTVMPRGQTRWSSCSGCRVADPGTPDRRPGRSAGGDGGCGV